MKKIIIAVLSFFGFLTASNVFNVNNPQNSAKEDCPPCPACDSKARKEIVMEEGNSFRPMLISEPA